MKTIIKTKQVADLFGIKNGKITSSIREHIQLFKKLGDLDLQDISKDGHYVSYNINTAQLMLLLNLIRNSSNRGLGNNSTVFEEKAKLIFRVFKLEEKIIINKNQKIKEEQEYLREKDIENFIDKKDYVVEGKLKHIQYEQDFNNKDFEIEKLDNKNKSLEKQIKKLQEENEKLRLKNSEIETEKTPLPYIVQDLIEVLEEFPSGKGYIYNADKGSWSTKLSKHDFEFAGDKSCKEEITLNHKIEITKDYLAALIRVKSINKEEEELNDKQMDLEKEKDKLITLASSFLNKIK